MHSDYNKLINAGIDVFSVKTDAFTIKQDDLKKAEEILKFSKNIGGWRFSKDENIKIPNIDYAIVENKEIKIVILPFESIKLKDEWDVTEICNIFKEKMRVMVRADLPGCGKSYACEYMKQLGHKVLFACPTKELTQNYSTEGVTLNRFCGLNLNDEENLSKFDHSNYDVLFLMKYILHQYKKIHRIE